MVSHEFSIYSIDESDNQFKELSIL